MKPRNPYAASLRHYRGKRIPDKRGRLKTAPFEASDYLDTSEMIEAYRAAEDE